MRAPFPALVLVLALGVCRPAVPPGAEVPIQGYNLFALGVADLDGDGRDDLYTVNHNAQPTLLRSTGNAERPFEPLPPLPHDARFPAFADLAERPVPPDSGALVYWLRGTFHVEAGRLAEPVRGTLTFRAEPAVERRGGAEATTTRVDDLRWVVRFRLADAGHLAISHRPQPVTGWPVILTLDSDPNAVSIGRPGDHPERASTLRLRDYHALAIRDLNGDGLPDIVALGGGLRGRAAELVRDSREIVFLSAPEGRRALPAHPKAGCATRSAHWKGDTLRVTCARGQADNVWVWTGAEGDPSGAAMWRGGPAAVSTLGPEQQPGCAVAALVEQSRLPLAEEALCAEGDFDGDGTLELVVARPVADEMFEAVLYDLGH